MTAFDVYKKRINPLACNMDEESALVADLQAAFPATTIQYAKAVRIALQVVRRPEDGIFFIPQELKDRFTHVEAELTAMQDATDTVSLFSNYGTVDARVLNAARAFLAAVRNVVHSPQDVQPSLASFYSCYGNAMVECFLHSVRNLHILRRNLDPVVAPATIAQCEETAETIMQAIAEMKGRAHGELIRAAMAAEGFY